MTTHLFTYGTLQFPHMMRAVLGYTLPARPARLDGFSRHPVRRRVFPAIIPATDGRVPGYLIEDVSRWTLARIDDYEGPPFRRQEVALDTDDGPVNAWAYVLRPRYHVLLRAGEWDPEHFRRRWLDAYVREFERVYATGDTAKR